MVCNTCNIEKPVSEYYIVAGRLERKCKECKKIYSKELRIRKSLDESWLQKERDRAKEKWRRLYKSSGRKPSVNQTRKYLKDKRYRDSNKEKKAAWDAVRRSGLKSLSGELHHWSYKKEHQLDVIDITKEIHSLIHSQVVYDKASCMYRRLDNGELMDTKDKHIAFVKSVISLQSG